MYNIILNIRQSSVKKEYIFSKLIELQRITLIILKIKICLTWSLGQRKCPSSDQTKNRKPPNFRPRVSAVRMRIYAFIALLYSSSEMGVTLSTNSISLGSKTPVSMACPTMSCFSGIGSKRPSFTCIKTEKELIPSYT